MGEDHVYKGLIDGDDLGYMENLGDFSIEEVRRAVKVRCAGDACHCAKQVNTNVNTFPYENDWVGKL